MSAPDLGAVAIRKVLADSGVDAAAVQEVYFGNVLRFVLSACPRCNIAVRVVIGYFLKNQFIYIDIFSASPPCVCMMCFCW